MKEENNKDFEGIYDDIKKLILESRKRIYTAVNIELLNLYWLIGKRIYDMQNGEKRAKYGERVLEELSLKLTDEFGKGFALTNLKRMRLFYKFFPISATVSHQLTWSHYVELIKIKEKDKRDFYKLECINSNWDVRTLKRQKKSLLYERLMLNSNRNKQELLKVKGNEITNNKDLVKNPYILEFLNLKDNTFSESELEKSILNHLKEFMIELGNGFTFVGSEQKITSEGETFYVDLVFYNRIVKCFLLIDLKVRRILHRDIGQMEMYVKYYDKYVKSKEEVNTVGVLFETTKNKTAVKLLIENKNVFASIYKLNFPTEEELIKIVEEEKKNFEIYS